MIPDNIDFDLTEEECSIRDLVHQFAETVMRPAGRELDRLPADAVAARGSTLWEVHRKWADLDIRLFSSPQPELTPAQLARLGCLVNEELGWGDAGLAISLGASEFPAMLAGVSQNPELMTAFPSSRIGCWGITEPGHGSDVLDMSAGEERPALRKPDCVARRDGDDYVIDGQKAAWVSNGPIAEDVALYTAVDNGDGPKVGQRALPQGELFFDAVRVPARNMIMGPESYPMGLELTLCTANGFMGSTFVGCARSAYELALDYAKERVQGGVAIIKHQAVQLKLFEMFRKIEAARSLNRRVVLFNVVTNPFFGAPAGTFPKLQYAIASKVTSTQTAFEVASDAIQVFGGNGLSQEYPVEKIMRDARASLIEDGTNEILSLHAAARL
jgi:acyl-CoA dehydrogenase